MQYNSVAYKGYLLISPLPLNINFTAEIYCILPEDFSAKIRIKPLRFENLRGLVKYNAVHQE